MCLNLGLGILALFGIYASASYPVSALHKLKGCIVKLLDAASCRYGDGSRSLYITCIFIYEVFICLKLGLGIADGDAAYRWCSHCAF